MCGWALRLLLILCGIVGTVGAATTRVLADVSGGVSPSLQNIMDGTRWRGDRLETAAANVDSKWYDEKADGSRVPNPGIGLTKFEVVRKNQKLRFTQRYDAFKGVGPHVYTLAWNGSRLTTLYDDVNRQPEKRYAGLIAGDRDRGAFHTMGFTTVLEELVLDLDEPLFRLFEHGTWTFVAKERVGVFETFHVKGTGLERINADLDVWVAPAADFIPLRLIQTIRVKGNEGRTLTAEMADVELMRSNGLNVIQRARIIKRDSREPSLSHVEEITLTDYRVGISIDDDAAFALQFPKGTRVWDDVEKRSYIQGVGEYVLRSDGMTVLVKSGEAEAGDAHGELLGQNAPVPLAVGNSKARAAIWAATLALILCIGLLTLSVVRRHRRRVNA